MINNALTKAKEIKSKPYSSICFAECEHIIECSLSAQSEGVNKKQLKRLSEVLEYETIKFAIDFPTFIVALLSFMLSFIAIVTSVLTPALQTLVVGVGLIGLMVFYVFAFLVLRSNISSKARYGTLKIVVDEKLESLKGSSCKVKLAEKSWGIRVRTHLF